MRRLLVILTLLASFAAAENAAARSYALDSIAEWGKFPRFCVNTYRWADHFFNPYDSAYVRGSGYKFNVKLNTDSWLNHLNFRIPSQASSPYTIDLRSQPTTTMGVYLTYMALSVGYDINVSKLLGTSPHTRQRYQFGFNCSLLAAEAYWERNTADTRLTRFGSQKGLSLPFSGVNAESWGIDAYYFFNHKRYSQAAAFTYGKIQQRSQGSFYAGIAIYSQSYNIDFSSLPHDMRELLPEWWLDYHYRVRTRNYGLRLGYGYNWVFAPRWVFGTTLSPVVGVSRGIINSTEKSTDFALNLHFKMSVAWNNKHWFAGAVGMLDSSIVNDRKTLFVGSNLSFTASVGYRFNLW